MWRELDRYFALPRFRKYLLWEALLALALARLAMALLPFRRVASWLGTPGADTPLEATADEIQSAEEVGWAVGALARRVPWDARCLAQALAGSAMLRRRGLEGTVSFGVRPGASAGFDAHAWLRFGPCFVTGGAGHEAFQAFTSFSRARREA